MYGLLRAQLIQPEDEADVQSTGVTKKSKVRLLLSRICMVARTLKGITPGNKVRLFQMCGGASDGGRSLSVEQGWKKKFISRTRSESQKNSANIAQLIRP